MTENTKSNTAVLDTIREVIDHAGAGTVFGEPINQDGLTVLPAAKISGGGGGGGGSGPANEGKDAEGAGGGVGLIAKPLGVFVIKDRTVRWQPAVDVNKVILGAQIVTVAALLALRAFLKARRSPQTI
jgi:uncharacterized spore protein YtfJ